MKVSRLVTPHFFDDHDPTLTGAAPDNAQINGPYDLPDRSPNSLGAVHVPIMEFVRNTVLAGRLPVSVAGDCGTSIPVLVGIQAAHLKPQLVWLDGHADFNTPETSPSHLLGGMPLAMMVGRGSQEIVDKIGLVPISERDAWLVGARDIDPLEKGALEASQINRATLSELEALIDACTRFVSRNNIVAISFSGWNGQLEGAVRTCEVCTQVLKAIVAAAANSH
jgi:arginase